MASSNGFKGLLGKPLVRDFRLTRQNATVDREKRTIQVALSSDEPILHVIGDRTIAYVILDHKPASINLERVNAGGSRVLENHDPDQPLGFQRSPQTDGKILRMEWWFGSRKRQIEAFNELADAVDEGFSPGVSVGFQIDRVAPQPEGSLEGIPIIRATKWTVVEGTSAWAERDLRTGIGRAMGDVVPTPDEAGEDPKEEATKTAEEEAEEEAIEEATGATLKPTPTRNLSERQTRSATMESKTTPPVTPSPLVAMQTRSEEYAKFARSLGSTDEHKMVLEEVAREFALTGKPEAELFVALQAKRSTSTTKVPPAAPMLNAGEAKRYSITRAILADASTRRGGDGLTFGGKKVDSNCFEMEVSDQIQKDRGLMQKREGFFMPTGVALGAAPPKETITRAGLDTKTSAAGGALVFTEAGSFIELLRNRAMVIRLGATVLPGLQGNVAFPKQTGGGAAHWVAENPGADVQDDDLTLGQVLLSPKTLQSSTSYSRQLLAQGVVNIDNIVQNDLVQVKALAVDLAALFGTAANNQPRGIYNQSGVNSVAFGGAITYAKLVEMETDIVAANADNGVMAYLTTPEVRGKGKQTALLSNTLALPIWYNGELNGYRAEVTNQMSKTLGGGSEHGIVFGVWSELLIGEWGAMEVITDPYRLKKQGMIEVTTFLMVDIAVRYPQAFSKGTGLTP
jgi:HK97 family phage major capsid protein